MDNKDKNALRLLVLITTGKLADKASEMLGKHAMPVQYRLGASGTASSEIMDMLGLGSIDKCILMGSVKKEKGEMLLGKLHSELRLDTVNSGIAFTLPIASVSKLVLHILAQSEMKTGSEKHGKDRYIMTDTNYSLVCAVVNHGFDGDVMEAARAVGARGGTVLHSRRIIADTEIGIEALGGNEEKDIVLIITDVENRASIMNAISEKCGAASDAKGVLMSMPIDSVMGL